MPEKKKKILLIHLAGIGDLLDGLYAIAVVRGANPTSHIVLLTWRRAHDVARLFSYVDQILWLDDRKNISAIVHNFKTILFLRSMRFCLAINLYQIYRWLGSFKLFFFLALIHPKRSAGRNTDNKGFWMDIKCPESSKDPIHEVRHQLELVRFLGYELLSQKPLLSLDNTDKEFVDGWLSKHGLQGGQILIAIHPGGARTCKRWPWESFVRVGEELSKRYSARVILTGGIEEKGLCEKIASRIEGSLYAAGFNIGQSAWLFQRCRLVIADDSGPMHLAASMGAPLLLLMGPGLPLRHGAYPLDRANQIILHAQGCPVCYRKRCKGHIPFMHMSTEVVVKAASDILDGKIQTGQLRDMPERIRLLHVHTLPVISGSGINTFLSMDGLSKEKYDVELACADGGDLIRLVEDNGMRVRRLKNMVWAPNPIRDILAVFELCRLIRKGKYHIVHTHNSKAGFIGRLAAKLAGVPVVVHTVHGFSFHDAEPGWRRFVYRHLERMATNWCDRLIVISQPLIDWALRERIATKEKMTLVYSGIDLSAFRKSYDTVYLRQQLGIPADAFVVGEVAKLWEGKGHEFLLAAAHMLKEKIPSLVLLFVGEGDLRAVLEKKAGYLGIRERVIFSGFRNDVPALTHIMDVCVLPSLFEGMGRAIIEAQAAGKPIIASRVGGIPDLIQDGVNGLLVKPGSAEELCSALLKLYEDCRLRATISAKAAASLDERFDASFMVNSIERAYSELACAKKAITAHLKSAVNART